MLLKVAHILMQKKIPFEWYVAGSLSPLCKAAIEKKRANEF